MSRFQAKTSDVLEGELENLRRSLGLRANQKADLLREMASLAAWVVREVSNGRSVIARGEDVVRELDHPVVERLRRRREQASAGSFHLHLALDDDEVRTLAEILDRRRSPPAALLASLRNLAAPDRSPPELTWPEPG